MKNIMRILILVFFVSPMLAACASGNSAPSTSIHVTLTDFQFTPNSFTVPAGAQISFTAVNNGADEHSFAIMKLGHEIKTHFTDADKPNIYWLEATIEPGQTITDTFTAPSDPGMYQVLCIHQGHFEAGMVAKLIVVTK
ncbi:MAG TPA: cupredoxin domain-containing protein [Anaerolineales bacterium]